MYNNDLNIDTVMATYGVSASAARMLFHINRLVYVSRLRGIVDRRGVPFCFASKATLAAKIGKSERTAARCIVELKRAGLIESKRTKGLGHIYLCADCVSSPNAENGSSINRDKSYNNKQSNSIHPTDENQHGKAVRMDGHEYDLKPSVRPQKTPAPSVSTPATKGKPTPKRPRNDRAERRRAARAQYAEALRKRLFLGESGRTLAILDDDGTRSAAAEAAITMLSDGLAANRNIKVAGAYLTAAQYWAMVQWLDLDTLECVMERVNRADNVRNLTGYLYASLYNECAYRRLSAQVV